MVVWREFPQVLAVVKSVTRPSLRGDDLKTSDHQQTAVKHLVN
jgi:hypothetical protein